MGIIKKYKKFARKHRKGLIKANKMGLKAVWRAIGALQMNQNSEKKYFDLTTSISGTVTNASPYLHFSPFDGIVQGLTASDRVGDQIKALWLQMRSRFEWVPAAASGTNNMAEVRILVVMDTEPRAAAPLTAAQVADAVLATTSPSQVLTSPYKVIQTATWGAVGGRWKVLRDFKFRLDQNNKQKDVKVNINFTKNKYKGMRLKYPDANNYSADDRLYMIAVTEHSVSNDIVITGDYSRLCFVDN